MISEFEVAICAICGIVILICLTKIAYCIIIM